MNLLQRGAEKIAELGGLLAYTHMARTAFEHKVQTPRRPPSGKCQVVVNGRAGVQLVDRDSGLWLADCADYREASNLADQLECRA